MTTFDFEKYPIAGLSDLAVADRVIAPGVGQLILQVGSATSAGRRISLFGVAHPSQFSWIYSKYRVGDVIRNYLSRSP